MRLGHLDELPLGVGAPSLLGSLIVRGGARVEVRNPR